VAIRAAVTGGYSPIDLLAVRLLVAAVVLSAVGRALRVRAPRGADLPVLLALGVIGFALYGALLNTGEMHVSAGAASFLANSVPVITALLAIPTLGERLPPRGWAGVAVSLSGAGLIALGEGTGEGINWWAALVLGAALAQSIFFILQKRLLSRYHPIELTIYAVLGGAAAVLIWVPAAVRQAVTLPVSASAAALWLGIGPTLGYVTYAYALKHLPASRAASFLFLVPVCAIPIAWLWLGEIPGALGIAGGAIALAGVALVNSGRKARA
jgi:drug/metabolite transporter (DMT)-like permease